MGRGDRHGVSRLERKSRAVRVNCLGRVCSIGMTARHAILLSCRRWRYYLAAGTGFPHHDHNNHVCRRGPRGAQQSRDRRESIMNVATRTLQARQQTKAARGPSEKGRGPAETSVVKAQQRKGSRGPRPGQGFACPPHGSPGHALPMTQP
ncbi:hypothetical protein BC834DRAFT_869687, partial [Gloeopeniophorella convolvens]